MTGYEFEDYISALLVKMGFNVSRTGYSHDGGIDLLAEYERPLFHGKYIIQCKNYTGLVGQPEVRDLYGVVMSENANKGIIITPSDYTEQAYAFAQNKNIELINGSTLNGLISETDNLPATKECDDTGFNHVQYDYLMNRIDEDPTNPQFYLQALELLRNHIINGDSFVIAAGIFDKIIDLNIRMIKRCYRKKSMAIHQKVCWYRIAEAEIFRGNLGAATNIMLDNEWFYIKEWLPMCSMTRELSVSPRISPLTCHPRSQCILARNLYAAYKQVGFEIGCCEIVKFADIKQELSKKRELQSHVYGDFSNEGWIKREQIYLASANEYNQFLSGEFDDTFIFSTIHVCDGNIEPQLKSMDTYGTITSSKMYYKKNSEEIIKEVQLAFQQHGIG